MGHVFTINVIYYFCFNNINIHEYYNHSFFVTDMDTNEFAIQTLLHANEDIFHTNHVTNIHTIPGISIEIAPTISNDLKRLFSLFDFYEGDNLKEQICQQNDFKDKALATNEDLEITDAIFSTTFIIKGLRKYEHPVIGKNINMYRYSLVTNNW